MVVRVPEATPVAPPVAVVQPPTPPPAWQLYPEPPRRPDPTPVTAPEIADPRAEKLYREAGEARVAGDMGKAIVKLEEAAMQSPEAQASATNSASFTSKWASTTPRPRTTKRSSKWAFPKRKILRTHEAKKLRDGFDKPDAMLGKLLSRPRANFSKIPITKVASRSFSRFPCKKGPR